MKEFKIEIPAKKYDSTEELAQEYRNLIIHALSSVKNAYAPYSNFNVGAAILLDNGEIICGSNQENAAYPSGLCAERVALFYANSQYPNAKINAIAITAFQDNEQINTPISPCGACRQSLLEPENKQKSPIKVLLIGKNEIIEFNSISDLLPFSFGSIILK